MTPTNHSVVMITVFRNGTRTLGKSTNIDWHLSKLEGFMQGNAQYIVVTLVVILSWKIYVNLLTPWFYISI